MEFNSGFKGLSWFFFTQLYQDAGQQKIKTILVAYFRCWNLLFQNPTNWL